MREMLQPASVMQAFTAITMLNIMANGQTTCNQGMGRVMYERLPNQQLQGFDDDVVRDTAPPFRVLEKCQDLCLRDRSANSLVRTCSSFDFQPGGRIAAFSGTPEYEESTCYLTREQAMPEGIGSLMLVPNSVHFNEICLTSNRPERECPSRRYVFERHARKKLKLPSTDLKEFVASNRTECEDKCLNEFSFVCRSASYDVALRTCSVSRFTRRTHPEMLEDDHNSDYLENTCLNAERRCDGLAVFVKEENKRLGGPFEADVFSNLTLEECQSMCIRAEKYFCRSVEYDENTKQCIVSEEDSVSQKDDITASSSPSHHFYDLVCLDNPRGSEYPDNSVTSHLFSNGRRPDTAFQRYRNSRLGGEFHSEITGRSLSECLDECLRQTSFQCRSAVYSDRFRTCRLSRFNQRDAMRIIYDADYDYYENLMHQMLGAEGEQGTQPGARPEQGMPGAPGWGRPAGPGGPGDRYPPGNDRYPDDDRFDDDRFPPGDRFPGRFPGGDRYPGGPDRFPGGPDRIPGYGSRGGYYGGDYDRFPDRGVRPERPEIDRPGYVGGGGYRRPLDRPGGYRGGPGYPPGPGPAYERPIGGYPYEPGLAPVDIGPARPGPFGTRCDEDSFKQIGVRQRMQRRFIRRFTTAQSLAQCQRECIEARDFICRSFNFREGGAQYGDAERDNCELSDRDTREMDIANPSHFESSGNYDFYERSLGRAGGDDCLDVSQVCNEDGMEFTLRLPEGFYGRIYTYGFYDRCFFRGNGGTVNALRISGAHGYPECGTQRYGDTMTNIVVVQFSDNVQTSRDKRFNLTCLFRGPAEAVVTSNYIGAGSGSPIPIEYLPEESSLNSKVRLLILYQGRPTTTIAVGDPLTFRLEAQDGHNYATDIFATNVIARDPYSGRSVQLIDRAGCPVDSYVFPELYKGRSGDSLEAIFNAFKIPESNFLVFEATVRTCRDGCQPAYCPSTSGRSDHSFGRKKREINATVEEADPTEIKKNSSEVESTTIDVYKVSYEEATVDQYLEETAETPKHVRKMIEVFDNRNEMMEEAQVAPIMSTNVCITSGEYHGLLTAVVTLLCLLMTVVILSIYGYRRYWSVMKKNIAVDRPAVNTPNFVPPRVPNTRMSLFGSNLIQKPFAVSGLSRMCDASGRTPSTSALQVAGNGFDDPSEPIYTDPSLFERSRSLRSLDMRQGHGVRSNEDLSKHIM